MKKAIIVAVSENAVIGNDNALPWKLSSDLKRFKQLTEGNAVIMGRNTWESLPQQFRPLPNRYNIVVSTTMHGVSGAYDVVTTLDQAFALAETAGCQTAFVIGGRSVFAEALSRVDECFLTKVHARIEGDVRVPELVSLSSEWVLREESPVYPGDEQHTHPFSFLHYVRASSVKEERTLS